MNSLKHFGNFCLILDNSSFLEHYNAILSTRTHFILKKGIVSEKKKNP